MPEFRERLQQVGRPFSERGLTDGENDEFVAIRAAARRKACHIRSVGHLGNATCGNALSKKRLERECGWDCNEVRRCVLEFLLANAPWIDAGPRHAPTLMLFAKYFVLESNVGGAAIADVFCAP